jgi:hypothetical protein
VQPTHLHLSRQRELDTGCVVDGPERNSENILKHVDPIASFLGALSSTRLTTTLLAGLTFLFLDRNEFDQIDRENIKHIVKNVTQWASVPNLVIEVLAGRSHKLMTREKAAEIADKLRRMGVLGTSQSTDHLLTRVVCRVDYHGL